MLLTVTNSASGSLSCSTLGRSGTVPPQQPLHVYSHPEAARILLIYMEHLMVHSKITVYLLKDGHTCNSLAGFRVLQAPQLEHSLGGLLQLPGVGQIRNVLLCALFLNRNLKLAHIPGGRNTSIFEVSGSRSHQAKCKLFGEPEPNSHIAPMTYEHTISKPA